MNNIESKVLEMKFDNEQFESAVATTMSTLDKFKEKLKFDDAGKNIHKLGQATNNYQYSLNDVGTSLSNLERYFSSCGTIGSKIFDTLTTKAANFVTNGIGQIVSSITQGGMSRAMNLEQARFQMQGILKDTERVHQVIYDEILPELQGTPYSLDQAAVVIGQIIASGKKSTEEIKTATKAISGVAAMTNSDFASIGNIFAKVAGNGRVMGDTLQQLASRGLNAAADLTTFFNGVNDGSIKATKATKNAIKEITGGLQITEQQLRDFVSDKDTIISYDMFSEAMSGMYGAQAQKSVQMYTGALEDLKAALARIGAEPAALRLNFLRDAFNALVPAVDAVNAVIKPFWNSARTSDKAFSKVPEYVKPFTGSLSKKVQETGWAFQSLFVQLDKNHEIVRATSDSYEKLGLVLEKDAKTGIKTFYDEINNIRYDEKQALMNPNMLRTITSLTKSMVNVLAALGKVVMAVGKGMKLAFPKLTLETIAKFAEHVEKFTAALMPSELTLRRFIMVAHGAFTPIGLLVRGAVVAIRIFIRALKSLYEFAKPALDVIGHLAATIGQSIVIFGSAARHLGNAVINIGKFSIGLLKTVASMLRLNKVAGFFNKAFSGIGDLIGNLFTNIAIKTAILATKLESITGKLNINDIATKIAGLTSKVVEFFNATFHLDELRKGFEEFWTPIKEFLDSHSLFDTIINGFKNLVEWIGKLIGKDTLVDRVATSLSNLQSSIGGFTIKPAGKIRKWLGDLGQSIAEFLGNLDKAGYVSEWLRDNFKILQWLYQLAGPIKKIWKPLGEGIISFAKSFTGIKTSGELLNKAADWIKSGFEKIVSAVGLILNNNTGKKLQSSMGAIFNDKFAKNAEKIGKGFNLAIKPLSDALSKLGQTISGEFSKLDPQTVKKFLVTLVLLGVSFSYMETLRNARATIKGFLIILDKIAEIPKAFALVAKGFQDVLSAFKAIAKAITGVAYILAIAASLVVFAAALKILSTIDTASLINGTLVLGIAVVAIIGLFNYFNHLDLTQTGDRVLKLSLSILGVGASMMLLALAVKVMADTIGTAGGANVIGAIAAISTLIIVIGILGRMVGNRAISKNIAALGWASVGIGQGMKILAEACTVFSKEMSPEEMDRAVLAIMELLVMFSLFAAANWHGNSIKGAAFSMIGIAIAIEIMSVAMKSIGKGMDDSQAKRATDAISSIIAMFSVFAFLVGLAAKLGAGAFTAMGILLSATLFMKVLAESMDMMSGLIDGGKIDKITEIIQSFMAIMAVISLISAVGGVDAAAGPLAIAALATALLGLAAAIYILGNADLGVVTLGFLRLGAALAGLIVSVVLIGIALKGFAEMITPKDALGILAIAAGMTLFALTITMLAELPIDALAIAIGGLIGILVATGIVLLAFSAVGPGLLIVAAAFALVGAAALFVGAGLFLVTLALSALIPLIVALGGTDLDKLNAGINVLTLTADGLKEVFYRIADGVLYFGAAIAASGFGLLVFALGIAAVAVAVIVASVAILALAGSFAVLASVLDAFVPQVKDSVLGTLGTLIGKVGEFFSTLRLESGSLVKETEEMKNESAKNAAEAPKSAQEAFNEGTSGLVDSNTSMWNMVGASSAPGEVGKTQGTNLLDSLSGSITSDGPGIMSGAFDGIVDDSTFAGMRGMLGSEGSQMPGIFGTSMEANASAAKPGGEAVVNSAAEGANSAAANASFAKAAETSAKEWASALGKSKEPKTKAESMSKNAAKAMTSGETGKSWNSAGESAAKGFAAGMGTGTPKWVTSAARSMAKAAIAAAKDELDVNSPSKVFIGLGKSVGEGFVMGIDAMASNVKNTTEDLMGSSIGAARIAAAAINAATEIDDFNPTITPVVDLTNVDQSVSKMNSMFGTAFGVATPFGAMNAAFAAQSFADSRNQNAKLDSINRLASKLDRMTETMNSRSLNVYNTIDGAADPEAFADGLIRSFRLNARTV